MTCNFRNHIMHQFSGPLKPKRQVTEPCLEELAVFHSTNGQRKGNWLPGKKTAELENEQWQGAMTREMVVLMAK